MAITILPHEADSPTRKRSLSFDDDEPPTPDSPSLKKVEFAIPQLQLVAPTPISPYNHRNLLAQHLRRRSVDKISRRLGSQRSSMQTTQAGPRTLAAPMPSFMSVLDSEAGPSIPEGAASSHDPGQQHDLLNTAHETCFSPTSPISHTFSIFHHQRGSTSTSASDSSESSPTTTISTLDSSSIAESSPGTSPETPALSISPLSAVLDNPRFTPPERAHTDPMQSSAFDPPRPTTPARKPRNLKNLAVDTTTATYPLGRAVASATLNPYPVAPDHMSAPVSPAFVKPPTPPKRKLGNLSLTIQTPANSTLPRLAIPSTPVLARPNTLRHFQSSPSLPLCTPSNGPPGGMTLPAMRHRPTPLGFADIPLDEEEEPEPNFDVPQSQEDKPDSYPNGPIRIYESGVDLYYEPTVEVASQYDVIFNVASEVKNPFLVAAEAAKTAETLQSPSYGVLNRTEESASPDTPKATPITTQPPMAIPAEKPEYIHIPWEHNTDIVPDLLRLVKLIDDRVSQGKRVLVHCQCGVSRSASLIVAYGMYKNPGMTVQEAYDAVKKRSKWIGPNMNLIMQLQEFRSSLMRNARHPGQSFSPRNMPSGMSSASRDAGFGSGSLSTPQTPRTAPLPPDVPSPTRSSTGSLGPLSAGLGSGRGSFFEPGFRRSWAHSPSNGEFKGLSSPRFVQETPYVDTNGHVIPIVTVAPQPREAMDRNAEPQEEKRDEAQALRRENSLKRKTPNFSRQLPLRRDWGPEGLPQTHPAEPPPKSPHLDEFHMVDVAGLKDTDMGDTFGILSPIQTEFPSNPFENLVLPPPVPRPQPASSGPTGSITNVLEFAKHSTRNDSMEPTSTLMLTPPRHRTLRTKFSSPTLREQIRLRQLQTSIEAALPNAASSPKRHQDDLDALMSPRATEFTVNPFHELLAVGGQSQRVEPPPTPGSPATSESDPRSPAQHGISPITRSIFDVL